MLKTDKRNRIKAFVLAMAMAASPFAAHAAGLGRITVLSALGQPLKAELEVSATRDEVQSLVAKMASVDAFRQAGIEYVPALATLHFSRDIKEREGRRYIHITTDRPLNEPFIDMLVELSWASGRLVREYTFLLDPPDLVPVTAPVPVAVPEVSTGTNVESATAQPVEKIPAASVTESHPVGDARLAVPKRGRQVTEPPAQKIVEKTAGNYEVVTGDTLGRIAARTKPDGVSLDQMLVALFRSNKEVFGGSNMNRLRAGKILAIPDSEEAGRIAEDEARREIVAHAADFNAYRRKLAAAATAGPAGEDSARQTASGKIAPKVEDKAAPAVSGKDKLEVSRTEVASDVKDGKSKALQSRITTLEEDLVARDKALQEANSRAADLEKNLNDMKRLAELKSQAGTDLQQQAQTAKPVVMPTVSGTSVVAPKPADSVKLAEASKSSAEATRSAEAGGQPASEPPPPRKRPVPPPAPEPEPEFLEENGLLVFGGGGVVALLLGWLGFSAWRKKREAAAEMAAAHAAGNFSVHSHSVFNTPSVAPPPSELEPSQFSVTSAGMAGSMDAMMDAVSEADTFLAFGREAQAEEVLLAELEKNLERYPLYLKLLEIYAGRRNLAQFEAMAKRLHAQTGGIGADWERAAALGASLDPENALYRPVAAVTGSIEAAPAEPGQNFGATTVLQAGPAAPVSPEPVIEPAPAVSPAPNAAPINFDLDLDLGASGDRVAATNPEATQTLTPMPDMTMLDFDLDLGAPEASTTESVSSVPLGLDLPLGDERSAVATAVDAATAAGASGAISGSAVGTTTGSIDFEFDLGTPDTLPASAGGAADEGSPDVAASSVAASNLGSISLELETPAAPAAVSPAPTFDLPSAEAAAAMTTDATDNSEVATKFELAIAYEEMGDKEGARELYQEALAEGSPAQQDIARAKLASLA